MTAGVTGRGPDPRAERSRAAALAAAQELLIEEGWAAVTHVAVAARSGVGRTTLYRHWPDSAMLIRQLLAQLFQIDHSLRTGDLREDLICELRAFQLLLENPTGDRALRVIIDQASIDEEYADVLEQCRHKGAEVLTAIIDHGREQGDLPQRLGTEEAIGLLLGPMFFRRLVANDGFERDYVPELVDGFLRAYAVEAPLASHRDLTSMRRPEPAAGAAY
ncbi:TetR-like C-terminal domain-containing protein [Streptomyces zagrosensis]|uniref:AcrR family transcriptional regulator n=1 Tax=Streptomyces zagrosensis TaxID=1042984 RepID=A0A7W9QB96_9ACTN|nr:TetR-like C-terminal domain-containing protein [Streptomyces zagrosensis]MBB5936964.1 AcrR family transcriptional regulator [Streptomyces zagrosensis]